MALLCGWASQSENKTANGRKGDQTKKEVKVGNYYNFGQDKVIRFKNPARGVKAGKAMMLLCKNDKIGYGQKDRISLFNQCVAINWDIKKISSIGLCNCDCSELCACAINFAYGKVVVPSNVCTRNFVEYTSVKKKANFKTVRSFSTSSLKPGDVVLKEGRHVIMVISK